MPITITTWNVQNFRRNDPVYADKLSFLTAVLQATNSDVIALQEILDPNALADLAAALGFTATPAPPDGRGIAVAFLSRTAPTASQVIDQWQLAPGVQVHDFGPGGAVLVEPQFPRAALEISITYSGVQLDIVTSHMKSKLLSFNGNFSTSNETLRAQTAYFALQRRAAEAVSLREHVSARLAANHAVVLLGDFNDGPEAATTQILYGPPAGQPRGPEDATHATGAFQRADADDPRRLFNVVNFVPKDQRWTRKYNGQNELLDHILASEELMPRVGQLRQVPNVSIYNTDTPNLFGEHPTIGGVVPDHAPVTAEFV